jgi:hypothetical protein
VTASPERTTEEEAGRRRRRRAGRERSLGRWVADVPDQGGGRYIICRPGWADFEPYDGISAAVGGSDLAGWSGSVGLGRAKRGPVRCSHSA